MPPDYVAIGHLTKDLTSDGYAIGGTVAYAAVTARNLGYSVGIVTSYGPDVDPFSVLSDVSVIQIPATQTTTFENLYVDGYRRQFIHAIAASIDSTYVPPTWRQAPILHLGPLVNEISSDIVDLFSSHTLIGVTPQGWMRQWNQTGLVEPQRLHDAEAILRRADIMVLSEEDVAHLPGEMERLSGLAETMIATRGRNGATLFVAGKTTDHPAFEAQEIDPTGAGDVFAAAFLIRFRETNDPHEATRFANAVASFSVERPGIWGIPSRAQVEHRLRHGRLLETRHE